MKVFKATTSNNLHYLEFIGRKDASNVIVVITDKDTKTSSEEVINVISNQGVYGFTIDKEFKEGSRYSLTVLDQLDNSIIYRDMILCTDEVEYDKYDIQTGDYVFNDTPDNDYVIL